jgi:hypothetical protein
VRAARAARRFLPELARRHCRRAFSREASAGGGSRPAGLVTAFSSSGSAKGQFPCSLAKLLFAHHWAAQSKLRRLRGRLGPESMRRAMKSTRLRLAAGSSEWVAVMHGTCPIPSAVRGCSSFARRPLVVVRRAADVAYLSGLINFDNLRSS